ncbi:indolepyruvate ferredoxin oxidoreductase subunit alpha [Patescibacteria group bacterium]|nr:indolepyruvate ferredoxin oxidoreductase subunit alpha [Patescibacteria group bacterium]MBU4274530.1 indolepyruvate ferredoxin oxidoreductase subunit alpha [Patescibacteria group bacterium]MBU4367435.1 indolepyruvate ferredoxin oxidoreductase subunit alpha [Patescibacteria group bacterium]MBU4461755.1 indolepyruvate ferredoxin oxidoreductase subunit alpha [Patescibacteria group bacterium]MCG2700139.1 thiamine pyrophosphate-dependent enzyme [Candidatus Parcubacteria bacterium]
MIKKILLGNEAIVQGALEAGVNFVSAYPGTPSSEIGNVFSKIAKENGVYFEFSTNEKVALEAAIGASFSGLKSLVAMKSFGVNVCLDSLIPLLYTGVVGPMVIIVADDPSCWSSAQSEENSRAFAYLAHIPILEPADPQEAKDFTKFAFKLSEKFKLPVIVKTTTRVAHQRMPVVIDPKVNTGTQKTGEFIKNPHQFVTMPPRVLEMKKELLEKIEKIRDFAEKSPLNKVSGVRNTAKVGIITSGVSYLHTLEALKELNLHIPVLKLGFFYPLPKKIIQPFIKKLNRVLVVEELEGYLEKEITALAKDINPKLQIFGKNLLSPIGELNANKITFALAKILGRKYQIPEVKEIIPKRYPNPCLGCPHLLTFSILKKLTSKNIIFGGDIGCYMLAGMPQFNLQDYLFSMGSSVGIGHGIMKATKKQKVIALMGDSTFFHAGISALINTVFNKSSPLIIVLDNRTTAMTGHQTNPGIGKTGMGEDTAILKPEEIAVACGVKNIKVIDPVNIKEYESTIKEFLNKKEVSLIVARRICALLIKKQKNG